MEDETNNLGEFGANLLRLLYTLPQAEKPAVCSKMCNADSMTLMAALAEAEIPHKVDIEKTVFDWVHLNSEMSKIQGDALFFLRMRIETALQFVLQMCHHGMHPETSMFSFPDNITRKELARYLFTDWWETHGRRNAVMHLIVEYHDESRDA